MPKQVFIHHTDAEVGTEIQRALHVARSEGHTLTIDVAPESATGDWLVEIERQRPWSTLASAVRDALTTWEKTSIRTIGNLVAKMDAVRRALIDVTRD